MTYPERLLIDPDLRAFVDAEIARAHVELQALRVENAHLQNVIAAQKQQIEAERVGKGRGK